MIAAMDSCFGLFGLHQHGIANKQTKILTEGKGPIKRIKHFCQTLSNIVRWCWTVFHQCWIVLDAGVFKRIQHYPTMLGFSTGYETMAYF